MRCCATISFIAVILLLTLSEVRAQQISIDSLKAQLSTTSAYPQRIALLHQLNRRLYNGNPTEALQAAEEALALATQYNDSSEMLLATLNHVHPLLYAGRLEEAELKISQAKAMAHKLRDEKQSATATYYKGMLHYNMGDLKLALVYYDSAVVTFEKLQSKSNLQAVYSSIGSCYSNIKGYDKAIEAYKKSLENNAPEDVAGRSTVFLNLANAYKDIKDYEQFLFYNEKALHLADSLGEKLKKAVILVNMGSFYIDDEKYELGMRYLRLAKAGLATLGHRNAMAATLNNMGVGYRKLKMLDSAEVSLQTALAIRLELQNEPGISACYTNLGDLSSDRKNYVEAISYYEKGIVLSAKRGIYWNEIEQRLGIGNAYEQLDNGRKALSHYQKAFELAAGQQLYHFMAQAGTAAARLYRAKGQYKEASAMLEASLAASDSVNKKRREDELALVEAKFRGKLNEEVVPSLKKSNELKQAQLDATLLRQNWLITSIALVSVIAFVTLTFSYQFNQKKQKTEKIKLCHPGTT